MGWRGLLQRLLRRRPQKDGGEPKSPGEELRHAVQEVKARQETLKRRHPGKQHHIDDYRELHIDGTKPEQFSSALMDLTRDSYANRQRLDADGKPRTELPAEGAEQLDPERLKQKIEKDADEVREDMKKRGARERKHYYSASERGEVGEIDRTYRIEKGRKDRPPRRR